MSVLAGPGEVTRIAGVALPLISFAARLPAAYALSCAAGAAAVIVAWVLVRPEVMGLSRRPSASAGPTATP
ncbi:hypothetical protein ABH931_006761 [Streptacidiphilus sp. MAP12-33]|uniref:hypothetical protein n=1 Tax=Streptacidiphilus sp. MAP12-33 TaxID=3156266 RepID=UPI003517A2DC